MSDFDEIYPDSLPTSDEAQLEARDHLRRFFNTNRDAVFFSRQLEVQNEDKYFHWITNRALHDLEAEGLLQSEWRKLNTGTSIMRVSS